MMWGSFGGVLTTSNVAIAEREQLPLISVTFGETKLPEEEDYNWSFFPFPNSKQHAESTKAVLDLIPEDQRPTRIGQWVPNTEWSINQANYWEETLSNAGYEMVFREKHQLHASDFSSLISKSESADVEALLGTPAPDGGITAMKQINESNFTPEYLQFVRAADTSGWWNALGEAGRHVVMAPGWVPGLTSNGNEELIQTYRENYDVGSDVLPPVMVGASYNLTQVFEQAVNAAGSTDKGAVRDALRNNDFQTVVGDFGFDEYGRPSGLVSPFGQWIDGQQHLIYPETDGEAFREIVHPFQS
jgi:branched-chain amino acid transport system substrate-binding protein